MERGFNGLALASTLLAWNIGWNSGILLTKHTENAEGRVEQVQKYNEELQHQLQPGHKLIAHLVLKDGAKTYSFETVGETGQAETCTGEYQVKQQHAAATGRLACTETMPVTR